VGVSIGILGAEEIRSVWMVGWLALLGRDGLRVAAHLTFSPLLGFLPTRASLNPPPPFAQALCRSCTRSHYATSQHPPFRPAIPLSEYPPAALPRPLILTPARIHTFADGA
jgi:hypothetical protein